MLNKRFAINLFANIWSFIVSMSINFLLTPYLIKTLGKEAYSFFPLANSFISYASIITVALNSMAGRFITIKIQERNIKEANVYYNSVLMANTLISLVFAAASILMVVFLDKLINIPTDIVFEVKLLFSFVFIALIISVMTSIFGVATFAKNRLDLVSISSIVGNAVKVGVLLALFIAFVPTIWYIGVANLIFSIFMLVTNVKFSKKLLPELVMNKSDFRYSAIKELLSSGIWNSINQLSFVLLTTLDLLIANILLGTAVSADYSIVKTIPTFIQSFVVVLVGIFAPQFTILYAQKRHQELLDNINQSIKFMGLVITIPIGFLIIFGDVFFSLWVPGQDCHKLQILSNLTIIPMIVTGSINTIFNVYTVTNKLKTPSIVLLITGILNTLLTLLLIKATNFGIYSIPVVSLVIGMLRNLIFTPVYAAKCLDVNWKTFYFAIIRGCFCSVVVIFISYGVKLVYLPHDWITFVVTSVLCSGFSFVINTFIVLSKEEKCLLKNKITLLAKS